MTTLLSPQGFPTSQHNLIHSIHSFVHLFNNRLNAHLRQLHLSQHNHHGRLPIPDRVQLLRLQTQPAASPSATLQQSNSSQASALRQPPPPPRPKQPLSVPKLPLCRPEPSATELQRLRPTTAPDSAAQRHRRLPSSNP